MQARLCHHWHFRHHQRAFWGHKVHVSKRMPNTSNDNTERAWMLARGVPFLRFDLHCRRIKPFILTHLKHFLWDKTSQLNVRRWCPALASLVLLLAMCTGCSMQKRTTQSGWHVESSVWKKKGSPQTECASSEMPSLRLPRQLSASTTLPSYKFKRDFKPASKVFAATSFLPSTPAEFRPWVADTLPSDTTTQVGQDSILSQEVEINPTAISNSEETPNPMELDPLTLTAVLMLILGVGVLPSPLGAFLIAIGVIVFLVGRIVKLANKRKTKGRGARIAGNILLIILASLLGAFATIVLLLESLFGEWTPIQDFFTWLFGG